MFLRRFSPLARTLRNTVHRQRRLCTTDTVISAPVVDGESKEYAENIKDIVNSISRLSLLEVADLNELLKKTLNISDAPMMAMAAAPAAATKEDDDADEFVAAEKTSFNVTLKEFDSGKKVALIKEIKNQVEGMNLVAAKKFVESVPQLVRSDITKDEAEQLKTLLEGAGGVVDIK